MHSVSGGTPIYPSRIYAQERLFRRTKSHLWVRSNVRSQNILYAQMAKRETYSFETDGYVPSENLTFGQMEGLLVATRNPRHELFQSAMKRTGGSIESMKVRLPNEVQGRAPKSHQEGFPKNRTTQAETQEYGLPLAHQEVVRSIFSLHDQREHICFSQFITLSKVPRLATSSLSRALRNQSDTYNR